MEIDEILIQTMIERLEELNASINQLKERPHNTVSDLANPKILESLNHIKGIEDRFRNMQITIPISKLLRKEIESDRDAIIKFLVERDAQQKAYSVRKTSIIISGLSSALLVLGIWALTLKLQQQTRNNNDLKYQFLQTFPGGYIHLITHQTDSIYEARGNEEFKKLILERQNKATKHK